MSTMYDPTPIAGYGEGLIRTTGEKPVRITVNGNPNDWFTLLNVRYNVHPFRSDLGGYPVRWKENRSDTHG